MMTPEKKAIVTKLLLLGMAPQNRGYTYAVTAIEAAMTDPSLLHCMCKGLYLAVADHHDVDWRNVERCLRTAIRNAWKHGSPDHWQQEFGGYPQAAPSNANFIAQIAQMLVIEQTA